MKRMSKIFALILSLVMALGLFACGDEARSVKAITITEMPVVSSYKGEPIVFSSLGKISVAYSDETTEVVNITLGMMDLTKININSTEPQSVSVSYGEKTAAFIVTLTEKVKTVKNIEITNPPVISSHLNQELTFSSLGKITVNYSDNTSAVVDITSAMMDKTNVDTSSDTEQTIVITYEGKTANFTFTLSLSAEDILANAKLAAIEDINNAYNGYDLLTYSDEGKAELSGAKTDGIAAVNGATSIELVAEAKLAAINAMQSVKTIVQENEHPFNSVPSDYTVTPSNKGKTLTVTYTAITGVWQPIETTTDLGHTFPDQNVYAVTVTNDGSAEISFTINIMAEDGVTLATSGVLKINAATSKTIALRPVEKAYKVILFIDNCEAVHSRAGNVKLTDYGFKYDETYSTASEFNLGTDAQALYTVTDKSGVMANFAYTDISAHGFVPVFYNLNGYRKTKNQLVIGITNNGSSVARVAIKAGNWVEGQFVNYIDQHTSAGYGGATVEIQPGATAHVAMVMDYDGSYYNNGADVVPSDAILAVVMFNFDNCWYEEIHKGTTRSGNIDIIYFAQSALAA